MQWPYPDVDAAAEDYVSASGVELGRFLATHAGRLTARYYADVLGPLHDAGATGVWVAEVEECEPEFSMVHVVVVRLPEGPARDRVLAAAGKIVRAREPEAEPDVGSRYAILHTGE